MANTFTTQTLVDGERNAIIHAYMASDGVAGELTDQVLVDVSALSGAPSTVKVRKITCNLTGFSAVLEFDATADVTFATLPDGSDAEFDYSQFGGIQNNAGAGVTGDITISTTGFSASGDVGHITIWVQKS